MLENANKDAAKEKEMLLLQIQELRCTLSRSEEEANLREKMYKADIASLQKVISYHIPLYLYIFCISVTFKYSAEIFFGPTTTCFVTTT